MRESWILSLDNSKSAWAKHIGLWFVFYIGFSFITSFDESPKIYLGYNLLIILGYIAAYYPLRYILIPRLYKTNRKKLFFLGLGIHMLFVYLFYWGIRGYIYDYQQYGHPFQYFGEFLIRTLRFFSPSILLLVWEYQHNKKQHLTRIRSIEKEKLSTELKFLKAQINPHFLFNSLNNLYSFVITESPKATDMITRLTGILDYVLNKSQARTIRLAEELDTIGHYLELEQIRYGDRLQIEYDTSGVTDQKISPLILLSIIENAFKHGASGDADQPKIDIDISADQEEIHCRVWNTKSKYKGEINDQYKKGIGLSNIRRQLDLIYPNQHNLVIDEQDDSFEVSLHINPTA